MFYEDYCPDGLRKCKKKNVSTRIVWKIKKELYQNYGTTNFAMLLSYFFDPEVQR